MGLLDGFEKLINEHGSAVILKERIALANDKYAALEKKLADSALREKQLETEKQGFELENLKLKEKIRNLEEKLVEHHGQRLEKVKEEMLQLLAAHPAVTDQQLSDVMGIGLQLVMFHLTELENASLVHGSYSSIDPTEWSLAHEGRSYLVHHGLLS